MPKRSNRFVKVLSLTLSAFALVIAARAAQADTLFTAPLFPDGDNLLDCYVVNVSYKTRDVLIQVFNRDGDPLATVPATLDPGQERVATVQANTDPALAPRYCKFEVEGGRSHYRASALVRELGRGSISALSAE
jgi:hypothetical protein